MKGRFLLIIALFAVQTVLAAEFRGGEIELFRPDNKYIDYNYIPPEYISIEDLVYTTCIEEPDTKIRSSILCKEDTSFEDLQALRWGTTGNCFISSYDLSKKSCGEFIIESEYVKDDELVKISKEIKVNRFSSILDLVSKEQYSDGGWKNSTETASGIWVLSQYRDIYRNEIALANDWLKMSRDNEQKCWPGYDCGVEDTAKILAYLTLARNNDSLRIMHDGLVFLKKIQNYYNTGDIWNLTIRPFEPGITNCIITYNRDHLNKKNFELNGTQTVTYQITAVPTEKLIVICDQNIYANLSTQNKDSPFIYEGDNLTYTLPYACWPKDTKWGECDLRATLFALMTEIDDNRKDAAFEYVESLRQKGFGDEEFLVNQSLESETALYAYILGNQSIQYEKESLINWLRFRQNNEGSWGNGTFRRMIEPTAFSILGLLANGFTRNSENIEDAESWINSEELKLSQNKTSEYVGWNSTEKNALAFTVLKNNARPTLKFDPILIIVDKDVKDVDVFNPTTFPLNNVKYELSDNLQDKLHIEEDREDIPGYSYIKIKIVRDKGETGNTYGYLSVTNENHEIARTPVMVVNYPSISFTQVEDRLVVFGTQSRRLNFKIEKTSHAFNCKLRWEQDDISSKSDYRITGNSLTIDIAFKTAERMENTYKGEFTCTAAGEEFRIPVSIDVSRYSNYPFSIEPTRILMNNTREEHFIVKNNLDESLDVTINIINQDDTIVDISDKEAIIDPNDELNVTIMNLVTDNVNITPRYTIEVKALGERKTMTLQMILTGREPESSHGLLFWFIIGIIVLLLGGAGFAAYYYKEQLIGLFKKEKSVDKIKLRIRKLEEKEKKTAIQNMIRIMRMLNKEDKEIRERLAEEGFSEEEVNKAFESDDEDNEDEEQEPDEKDKKDQPK